MALHRGQRRAIWVRSPRDGMRPYILRRANDGLDGVGRTLDFGQDLSLSPDGKPVVNNRPRLYSRVIAYLAFPECLERRDQFLPTCGAELLQREFDRLDNIERDLCDAARQLILSPVPSQFALLSSQSRHGGSNTGF
jgi:hypothetical protein